MNTNINIEQRLKKTGIENYRKSDLKKLMNLIHNEEDYDLFERTFKIFKSIFTLRLIIETFEKYRLSNLNDMLSLEVRLRECEIISINNRYNTSGLHKLALSIKSEENWQKFYSVYLKYKGIYNLSLISKLYAQKISA